MFTFLLQKAIEQERVAAGGRPEKRWLVKTAGKMVVNTFCELCTEKAKCKGAAAAPVTEPMRAKACL